MTHAATRHCQLDGQAAHAVGEADRNRALLPSRLRAKDLRTMTRSRVLLTTLSVRASVKGNAYLAGWLGKASVVAFPGEADKFGNPTWDLFLSPAEVRDGPPAPRRAPPGRSEADGHNDGTPPPRVLPGGPHGAAQRPQTDGCSHA